MRVVQWFDVWSQFDLLIVRTWTQRYERGQRIETSYTLS